MEGSPDRRRFDVVIVGAGTAGCLLAAAAARSGRRVLLLEEGEDTTPELVADLGRQPDVLRSELVRRYPAPRPGGGDMTLLSGRILGGGWSVNHGAMVRPTSDDLAVLAGAGGEGWEPAHLVGLLAGLETDVDEGGAPWHGSDGPIRLARHHRRGRPAPPAAEALVAACEASGVPYLDDVNRPGDTTGITPYPYSVTPDGRRVSSATAVLGPVRALPNLTVRGSTRVRRVLVAAGRVIGVEAVVDGAVTTIDAPEVVLCAGVFHSPQLLLRSGIGPVADVVAAGLQPVVELPGVGRGFRDHAKVEVDLDLDPTGDDVAAGDFGDALKLHLRLRSGRPGPDPDLDLGLRHPPSGGAVLTVRLLEHRSAGSVSLDPSDPDGLPRVRSALLEDADDLAAIIAGIEVGLDLLTRPESGRRYRPQPPHGADWGAHARSTCGSYNHGVGTCRMGTDPSCGDVVDPGLAVHGVQGLRVADASVLPVLPHANTNAAAALVGLRASELLV